MARRHGLQGRDAVGQGPEAGGAQVRVVVHDAGHEAGGAEGRPEEVAGEEDTPAFVEVRDVARRVARRVEGPEPADVVAVGDGLDGDLGVGDEEAADLLHEALQPGERQGVLAGEGRRILRMHVDRDGDAVEAVEEGGEAADVVRVVVGDEDPHQVPGLPAALRQGLADGVGVEAGAGVDEDRPLAGGDEVGVHAGAADPLDAVDDGLDHDPGTGPSRLGSCGRRRDPIDTLTGPPPPPPAMTPPGEAAGPDAETESTRILVGILTVAALVAAFHRALPQVYALNFDTAGPGPTAGLVALLVTGWTLPLLRRGADEEAARRRTAWAGVAGGAALAASLLPHAAWAAVAALAAFPLLTPGLVALVDDLGAEAATVLGGGVLLHQALRVATGGAPLAATGTGRVLLLGLAALVAGAWMGLRTHGDTPTLPTAGFRGDAAPFAAALIAEAAFLGSAEAPATWMGVPRFPVAAASAVGLAAGATAAARGRTPGPQGTTLWAGLLAVAAADVAVVGLLGPGAVLLAQAALLLLVAGTAAPDPRRGPRPATWSIVGAQAGAVALLVGLTWAGNWAFVPAGDLVRDRGPAILALLLAWPALVATPTLARRWET